MKCLSISQRYILKANHNYMMLVDMLMPVFINKSKIHFESKSQQGDTPGIDAVSVYQ